MRKSKKKAYLFFAAAAFLYVSVVGIVAYLTVENGKNIVMSSVDARLKSAASTLKYLLAPDYHDRALAADSIGAAEELKNRESVNAFVSSTDFTWAYTLVERDGSFFFSAPTVTEKEAKERDRWYFYPYEDIPGAFREAFKTGKPAFVSYKDQWGSYRSIAFPERSPGGRPYLSCVDLELKNLGGMLRDQLVWSLVTSLLLLLAGLPFAFLYVGEIKAHNKSLTIMNKRLRFDAHAAENRFRSLFEHSADAVIVVDAEHRVSYLNPAFVSMFGWTQEEFEGRPLSIVPPELAEDVAKRLDRLRETREPYRDYETRRVTKGGSLLDVSISVAPLSDVQGTYTGALFIYRDRTQRKRLEARIAQDEKLRAVAALAAGAAHDFNNVLALIQGNVSLLKLETVFEAESAALVQGIESAVKSAAALNGELLGFARPEAAERIMIDLCAFCGQSARTFAKTRPGIRLSLHLEKKSVFVLADRNGLERVLLNLFVNADHAMDGEGDLAVSASTEVLDAGRATPLSLDAGSYAVVRITDTGGGMDTATLNRMFEPFYTTKKKGKGTGLGLAFADATLRAFGGSISAESELGKGTAVIFYLPEAAFAPMDADFTAPPHPDSMGRT